MVLTIIICLILVSAFISTGTLIHRAVTAENKAAISGPKLSQVAKEVKREYDALPADSRPFPDITSILMNLDEVTGDPVKRRRHFDQNWLPYTQSQNGFFDFSWSARGARSCGHHRCEYRPYWELHNTILEVQRAVDEKEKVLRQAKFDQDGLLELQQRLRDEAGIQKQIAKELS